MTKINEILEKIETIVENGIVAISNAETPEKKAKLEMVYSSHMRESAAAVIREFTPEEKAKIRETLNAGDEKIHAARTA